MVVTRIAPSPSGLLHAGNAVNFLLTDWLAKSQPGSQLHLRIDDMNLRQVAHRHLADIFWAVEWLGIGVTDGPSGVAEFRSRYSQLGRIEEYRAALPRLQRSGAVYPCSCSRTVVADRPAGSDDPCVTAALSLRPGSTALRFRTQHGPQSAATTAALAALDLDADSVAAHMGDVVVWRRDDLPAYHWASVLEDERIGVDIVVRGHDLRPSSAAQLLLADAAGAHAFTKARFLHHELLLDAHGSKLSKRDDADALRSIAQSVGGRQRVWDAAARIAAGLGIPRPGQ